MESDGDPISAGRLSEQLAELGVHRGGVLLVHTSYRALRPIAGGPAGLIDALSVAVGPGGTVVMPTWPSRLSEAFDAERHAPAPDLGIVPGTFWSMPGVERTSHSEAFSARGPHAAAILADPLPLPPHIRKSPVGRVHDLDGQVLLLGVNHDANTTIHLAEVLAGVRYGKWKECTDVVDGRLTTRRYLENDHCCERFRLVDSWLRERGLQAEGPVGHGQARLMRSADVVQTVVGEIVREPLIFLHDPSEDCEECDEARSNLP